MVKVIYRVTALNELRSELDAATDHKIAEIYKSHKEAISSLRSECEEAQQQAVLDEKSRGEEALHAARDEATRAMEQLKAEHMAAVNDLNEKMAAIQLELKNIENKYVVFIENNVQSVTARGMMFTDMSRS